MYLELSVTSLRRALRAVLVGLLCSSVHSFASTPSSSGHAHGAQTKARVLPLLQRLPLAFERNEGQASPDAAFTAHAGGMQVEVSGTRFRISLPHGHDL